MAKFKYVGDPNDKFSGPDTINQYGYTFRKGEEVEVAEPEPDKDGKETDAGKKARENITKLKGNSHFVDTSDKDKSAYVDEKQKALEKAEEDRAKAAEEQRKRDDEEAKALAEQEQKARDAPAVRGAPETSPRPPGTVTRQPTNDPFQGRTVEQRTQAEDHTRAGKTKS